jgi:hypothetical protein
MEPEIRPESIKTVVKTAARAKPARPLCGVAGSAH